MSIPIQLGNYDVNLTLSVHISNSMPKEFPFVVNIKETGKSDQICSGTILSTMLIVTAAHCLESSLGDYSDFYVMAGQHNLNVPDKTVEQRRKISKVYMHPNYIPGKSNSPYDIAVIVLKEPLNLGPKVNCLNPLTNVYSLNETSGKFGRMVGWGKKGESARVLSKADIEIIKRKTCNSFLKAMDENPFNNIYDSMICGKKATTSTCIDDVGWPMICKNFHGVNSLCGISALGPSACNEEQEEYEEGIITESYFTSLPYFYTWIKHNPMRDPDILRKNENAKDSTILCGKDEYFCDNTNKISNLFVCDRENDCGDGSDEVGCSPCNENEFKCQNGKCIADYKICDSKNDCKDGSDEFGCERLCQGNFFMCGSKKFCVNGTSVCDGINDCHDGTDESNCGDCEVNQFKCKNGKCVRLSDVCDYENDCKDGSDEMNCENCKNAFRCKNNECISNSSVCNKINDCDDGSDEIDCSSCTGGICSKKSKTPSKTREKASSTTARIREPIVTRPPDNDSDEVDIRKSKPEIHIGTDKVIGLKLEMDEEYRNSNADDNLVMANELRAFLQVKKDDENEDDYLYLQSWLNNNSDLVLLNFVKAGGFNLEEAEKRVKKVVDWRKTNKVEDIFDWKYPDDFPSKYPWKITGYAEDNKPVVYMDWGLWDMIKLSNEPNTHNWGLLMYETIAKQASKMNDPSTGLSLGNFLFIIDLHRFNFNILASRKALLTALDHSRIFYSIYPLYPSKIYLVRGPSYLPRMMGTISRALTSAVADTMYVIGSNDRNLKSKLNQHIPLEAIPQELGGKGKSGNFPFSNFYTR